MRRVFAWLKTNKFLRALSPDEFVVGAAHFLAELNAIHPFREGNGRTQLTFMALIADRAGHPFDLDKLDPRVTLDAMIESFKGREQPLRQLLATLIA